MKTIDEINVKLEELRIKLEYEIEVADNTINDNIIKIAKKIDEVISQYYNIRKNSTIIID